MLKHVLGVLLVLAAAIALGSIYNAVVDFNHYWLQGLFGVAVGGVALLLHRWRQMNLPR